ncbi:MAG: hypothetical protein QOD75_2034 [Blastocatellia bacterium]|jgi:hypothetical protein|nr:hypothetical protein [Blastocatellia bacterium]
MLTIWESNYPINNAEIARRHYEYFQPKERKDEDTVRGIISRIHQREQHFNRNYLVSRSRPKKHEIAQDPQRHPKPTVHSQASAIMLLELRNGYLKQKPKKEILRASFEKYLRDKYAQPEIDVDDRLFKDAADVSARLEIAESSGYVRFRNYGKAAGIEADARLGDDLDYLLLIVEDYAQQLMDQPQSDNQQLDLQKLLAAFGRPNSGGNRDSKGARA